MLSVLSQIVILPSVMETSVHSVITLILVIVIHADSVTFTVAVVMVIYVTNVFQLVVTTHVCLQTVLCLVRVLKI